LRQETTFGWDIKIINARELIHHAIMLVGGSCVEFCGVYYYGWMKNVLNQEGIQVCLAIETSDKNFSDT
jgi:hypothetical protein